MKDFVFWWVFGDPFIWAFTLVFLGFCTYWLLVPTKLERRSRKERDPRQGGLSREHSRYDET